MNVQGLRDFFASAFRRVDIVGAVEASTVRHESDIIQLNQQQLQQGSNADGESIRPEYAPYTVKLKRKKGQPTDRVTLRDKNDFYTGFYTRTTRSGTDVSSKDSKTPFLVGRYRETIFGLSIASKEQLRDRMRPTVQQEFKTRFFA